MSTKSQYRGVEVGMSSRVCNSKKVRFHDEQTFHLLLVSATAQRVLKLHQDRQVSCRTTSQKYTCCIGFFRMTERCTATVVRHEARAVVYSRAAQTS